MNKIFFAFLTVTFVFVTIVGTISHEFGHFLVAKKLGYKSTIHYSYTSYENEQTDSLKYFATKYSDELNNNLFFSDRTEYENLVRRYEKNSLKVILGGIVSTLLIGTIGFILLLAFWKKKYPFSIYGWKYWLVLFMSLFWVRQVAVCTVYLYSHFSHSYLKNNIDEVRLSVILNLPPYLILVITALIGITLCLFLFFKIIPENMRRTFLIAGIIGGILGYIIWFQLIGPVILP